LDLRSWKARKYEKQPEAGFHWRLGLRLGEINDPPQPSDAPRPRMLPDVHAKLRDFHQLRTKEHIGRDDSFCQWIFASEVDHCTEGRRGRKTAAHDDFLGR
jgi:hypothetical protein